MVHRETRGGAALVGVGMGARKRQRRDTMRVRLRELFGARKRLRAEVLGAHAWRAEGVARLPLEGGVGGEGRGGGCASSGGARGGGE